MSSSSDQPNPGRPRQLNLQQMADQFMVGVQRHFDMLAFNLASREAATEERYTAHSQAPRLMPAGKFHRNFEQMQAYARDLLFGQVVNDSLNLGVGCMHNAHLFLALIKGQREHSGASAEIQKQAEQKQKEFGQAQLDRKFNRLEEEYGVMCELEDTVISLGFVMQAIGRQGGVIKEAQLAGGEELLLELKVLKPDANPGDVRLLAGDLEVQTKTFRDGDKVEFTDLELQSILLTIGVFGHQLFNSVAKYARENRPSSPGAGE